MARPLDSTKLPDLEAQRLRDLLRRGKEQYGLTWRDVGAEAGFSEKQTRNYVGGTRPPSAQVAKALLRGVLCASGSRAWRQKNGCCPEHRTGDGISCMRRNDAGKAAACDPWYVLASTWWLSASWVIKSMSRPFVPALIAPAAFDTLAKELARHICSECGFGVGRRDSVAGAIFSYLNRNAVNLASDAVFIFGSRIEEIVKDAKGDAQPCFRDQLLDRMQEDRDELARFARSALMFVARLDWPNLKDVIVTTPRPLDQEAVVRHKDTSFHERLKSTREDD